METFIQNYGYWAILVGTFLEGETILILGGFAAHRGYLELPWVITAAFIGTLCGDQLFFLLGRWHSQIILARKPLWKARTMKAERLLARYRILLILSFRFLYGLRSVTPAVIGMSTTPASQFIILNAVGAGAWAIVVGSAGYLFGNALQVFLGNLKHHEVQVFVVISITGLLIWMGHFYLRRKKR